MEKGEAPPALARSLHSLELGAHVGVRPPVTEVVQAGGTCTVTGYNVPGRPHGPHGQEDLPEGCRGKDPGLNEPDTDHGASPGAVSERWW